MRFGGYIKSSGACYLPGYLVCRCDVLWCLDLRVVAAWRHQWWRRGQQAERRRGGGYDGMDVTDGIYCMDNTDITEGRRNRSSQKVVCGNARGYGKGGNGDIAGVWGEGPELRVWLTVCVDGPAVERSNAAVYMRRRVVSALVLSC